MKYTNVLCTIPLLLLSAVVSGAEGFSYSDIAARNDDSRLQQDHVEEARMHGECLVGLKQLIFVSRADFDPVAEWINYRTISLLEQFPPCTVLIMMEVARAELMGPEDSH